MGAEEGGAQARASAGGSGGVHAGARKGAGQRGQGRWVSQGTRQGSPATAVFTSVLFCARCVVCECCAAGDDGPCLGPVSHAAGVRCP